MNDYSDLCDRLKRVAVTTQEQEGSDVTNIANLIPAKIRATVYAVLGAAIALEMIWDVVPGPLEGKVLATLSALGFGMATANTAKK